MSICYFSIYLAEFSYHPRLVSLMPPRWKNSSQVSPQKMFDNFTISLLSQAVPTGVLKLMNLILSNLFLNLFFSWTQNNSTKNRIILEFYGVSNQMKENHTSKRRHSLVNVSRTVIVEKVRHTINRQYIKQTPATQNFSCDWNSVLLSLSSSMFSPSIIKRI